MTTTTEATDWMTVPPGTEVRVSGDTGVYVLQYVRNGEVTVWGGSKDPNGVRRFRTFVPERCRIYRPRKAATRMQHGPSVPPPSRRGRR